MQLNSTTDYALRVLIFLVINKHNKLIKLDEISRKFYIKKNHLTKIVAKLASLNYIITQRGNGGGMKIHPDTLELNLFDIMNKFESSSKFIDCKGLDCPISGVCRLEVIITEACDAYKNTLKKYKLKDILPKESNVQKIILTI
jgi:Rrf2 family nitric oxide-sensitive transcriptional repressor